MQTGAACQVIAHAGLKTWEIWTHGGTGHSQRRNESTSPQAGANVVFTLNGDGAISPASGTTDASGNCVTTFTMGESSILTATVGEASGQLSFEVPIIPETWTWDHDESLVTAVLSTTGTTSGLNPGETRPVRVEVKYHTWKVYVSNLERWKTGDFTISPAIGAQVDWSISEGDGTVQNLSSLTDAAGASGVEFTMGSEGSVVQAGVSYLTGTSTVATLEFSPPGETWTLDRVEYSHISDITIGTDGSTDGIQPGDERTLSVAVTATFREIYTGSFGNLSITEVTGPAGGWVFPSPSIVAMAGFRAMPPLLMPPAMLP